jgi:hypothetical protein
MSEEWPMERLAEQFRREVRERFEKENVAHRAEEEADIAKVMADPESATRIARTPGLAETMTVRDSFYWDIYSSSTIEIINNSVRIVLPRGFAIFRDFVEMFEGTSVAWSKVDVTAEIVDGEPRVVLHLILIDYWDDDRAAQWWAEKAKAPTTAEDLLRRIKAARVELAADPERPRTPIDTLYAIEYWIGEFFQQVV